MGLNEANIRCQTQTSKRDRDIWKRCWMANKKNYERMELSKELNQ